jgi:2-keto-4-pentenoate hydratase/2-oxohepta-3-ene-1,7-dioic acid hydratase in catechol pathway
MKLITFLVSTSVGKFERIGCLLEGQIIDLNMGYVLYLYKKQDLLKPYEYASFRVPPDMVKFFELGDFSMSAVKETVEFVANEWQKEGAVEGPNNERVLYQANELKFLAPFPRPNSVRDFFTFETHVKHSHEKAGGTIPKEWYQFPMYFKLNHSTVIGHEEEIIWPEYSDQLDYELELGIYIGKKGKDISKKEAIKYIAGYTIFNDVAARDQQRREIIFGVGPAKGKDFDCSCVMGPCLVTPEEITDPKDLKMIARVNGEVWSEGNTSDMYYSFQDLIEHASKSQTLEIGDFFGAGCVGNGCGLEHDRWVKSGDTLELEIDNIGILRNRYGEKLSKKAGKEG